MSEPVVTSVLPVPHFPIPQTVAELLNSSGSSAGYHAVSSYLGCPEKSRLRASGLRRKQRDLDLDPSVMVELNPLGYGLLIHALLGTRIIYGHDAAERLLARMGSAPMITSDGQTAQPLALLEPDRAKALLTLRTYDATHPLADDPWRYIGVESEVWANVALPGEPPIYRTVRYDGLVQQDDPVRGKVVLSLEHKCLPGDAVVLTSVGPMAVRDLPGRFEVAAWDGTKITWQAATVTPNTTQPIVQIATKGGSGGRFGATHPIWTQQHGWVEASQILPGDVVARGLDLPDREDATIADEAIRLAGMLLCDGSLKRPDLTWTKKDPLIRAVFKDAVTALGDTFVERKPVNRAPYIYVPTQGNVSKTMTALALPRVGSPIRFVPPALMSMSKRQIGVLIGAIWMGDGALYTFKGTDGKRGVRIIFGSRSRQFRNDVRDLLTYLGLAVTATDTSVEYEGERRPYYFTTIVGRASKERFLDMIESGFIAAPPLLDKVPACRAALTERTEINRVHIEGAIMWDKVTSALIVGDEQTYSISVPVHNTLIANGLITHNTAARGGNMKEYTGQAMAQVTLWNQCPGLVEKYGPMVGVIFDVIVKSGLPKCERLPPRYVTKMQQQRALEYLRLPNTIKYPIGADGSYPRMLHHCYDRYGACDYVDLCLEGARGEYEIPVKLTTPAKSGEGSSK